MRYVILFLTTVLAVGLMSCQSTPSSPPTNTSDTSDLQAVTLGVGFIPNIQFAPFYVAQAKGFYAEEGLDVSLEYGFENDFVALTATGQEQFAIASGDQVILSRAQGLPIVYVMKWYDRLPIAVTTPKESGIETPQDLAGHTVGIPGLFGASYISWKALAYANNLDESAIQLESIGFTQVEAISAGQVDAAVVYITNEPIQLSEQGFNLNTFEVSDYIDLVANGIVTNETLLNEQPELVEAMTRASLKGLKYTVENPDEAFDLARTFVTEMTDAEVPTQKRVLKTSTELWKSDNYGKTTAESWASSVNFMQETGLLETDVDIESMYTNAFIDQ